MKLSKRDLKEQEELIKLLDKKKLSEDDIEFFHNSFNPGFIDNLSQGVYFTPLDLAFDVALFCPRRGHVLDLCAGIGGLSHALYIRDWYDRNIKSITCIELNNKFCDIGKKLLPCADWVNGSVFEPGVIENLLQEKNIDKFDLIVSNPPFGKIKQDFPTGHGKCLTNYKGSLDLMVLELALRYSKNAYFILPANSVPFKYSGRQWYEDNMPRELERFLKANHQYDFSMTCDSIDCSIYGDQWKNLSGIAVEAVNIDIHPYSMDCLEDSITLKYKK